MSPLRSCFHLANFRFTIGSALSSLSSLYSLYDWVGSERSCRLYVRLAIGLSLVQYEWEAVAPFVRTERHRNRQSVAEGSACDWVE
jgi:hypothetical protein